MPTPLERARLVAKRVQIVAVSLSGMHVESHLDPFGLPPSIKVSQRYRARYECPTRPEERLDVYVDFEFRAHSEVDSRRSDIVLALDASFLVVYNVTGRDQLPKDALGHFATLNGGYNSWPYWRELVQSVTGRAGLPGIIVPVYRPANAQAAGTSAKPRKKK